MRIAHVLGRTAFVVALAANMSFAGTTELAKANAQRTEEANKVLDASLRAGHTSIEWIKKMLASKNYEALEKSLQAWVEAYKKDAGVEACLQRNFDLFTPSNGITIASLDAWVAQTTSATAYAARGIYKGHQAWDARGSRFVRHTPESSMELMRQHFLEAGMDLQIAVEKDPWIMPAHVWLVDAAKTAGLSFSPEQILRAALRRDERTYYVRFQFMQSLRPRWGGSHEQMIAFANECAELVDLNPRLWTLQGDVYADKADYLWEDGDIEGAIELYSTALSYGDRTTWLKHRATCYYKLGEYKKAMDDFMLALHYMPEDQSTRQWLQYAAAANAKK